MVGERGLVVRGDDDVIRAFHNVCRHRGSRVAVADRGTCEKRFVCPFHGWSYRLDGTLDAVVKPSSLPQLDPIEHGLVPLEVEIWHGLIFIRFEASALPRVHDIMARYAHEVAPYQLANMVRSERGCWTRQTSVNWKSIRDVDNEGYHVPHAHPQLHDLYGAQYEDGELLNSIARTLAPFNSGRGRTWSVRHYKSMLLRAASDLDHLPELQRRAVARPGIASASVCRGYVAKHNPIMT